MKILYFSHFIPYPPPGGSSQRNYNLIKQLSKTNTVHLLTFTQRLFHPNEKELNQAVTAMEKLCDKVKAVKIPTDYSRLKWFILLFFNLFSFSPYSAWRFRSKEMVSILKQMIKENDYDIVHVDTIALAGYIKYMESTPAVLNHHNIESTLMLRRAASEKNIFIRLYLLLQGKKLRSFEKRLAGKYSLNITVSEIDTSDLLNHCKDASATVVANGTDTEYFIPSTTEQEQSLIYVGGMTWYPNRDAMIYFCQEIYPRIKRQISDLKMNIIGNSPPKEVLRAADDDPSIMPLGFVDDIRDYLAHAAVYVVPIRVGGGTRLKILDAMASGKAIVSTSVGCEGINATDNDNIIIADTPEAFVDKVIRLLNDKQLRLKIGANARSFVEKNYSWEIIGRHLEQAYNSVKK